MSRPVSLLARFSLILVLGVVSFGVIGAQLVPLVLDLPDATSFEPASNVVLPELAEGSTILDAAGEPIGELVGAENRVVVPLSQMSHEMQRAVVAAEDEAFYEHNGISAKGILRALRANTEAGEVAQGGSTITQQLVKLSLVGDEQSLGRKLQEASIAVQLENQLCETTTKRKCKDRILEQYLNQVYLGRGVYGVEAAARTYFGVSAAELNWAQAALIASIIPNPSRFDPVNHPEVSRSRRQLVLDRLVDTGDLTREEADFIGAFELPTEANTVTSITSTEDLSYFERKVRDELLAAEWLAPTVELRRYLIFNGGLRITSTMDSRAQAIAETAAAENPLAARNPNSVVALASVEPASGAVRAIVGDTFVEERGVVETAMPRSGRSPGSSFKTFTLLAALEEGHSIRDTISASPAPRERYERWGIDSSVTVWPSNCRRGGSMDLRSATARSDNCAFARLQAAVGGDKVVDVARRLGIDTIEDGAERYASLTLGATTVRPLDMAAAYAALANDGRYNPPHFVSKVEDRDGHVLYEYEPVNEQVIPVEVAREATVALEAVVSGGTYRAGSLPDGQPAAGKTGTNELSDGGNADVWFVGYTPQMSTAVWIGDPLSNAAMRGSGVQGGTAAASVWRAFMAPYLEDSPVVEFKEPGPLGSGSYIPDPWGVYSSQSSADSSGDDGSDDSGRDGDTSRRTSSNSSRRGGGGDSGRPQRSTTTAPPPSAEPDDAGDPPAPGAPDDDDEDDD